jgi:hypothetical protein
VGVGYQKRGAKAARSPALTLRLGGHGGSAWGEEMLRPCRKAVNGLQVCGMAAIAHVQGGVVRGRALCPAAPPWFQTWAIPTAAQMSRWWAWTPCPPWKLSRGAMAPRLSLPGVQRAHTAAGASPFGLDCRGLAEHAHGERGARAAG